MRESALDDRYGSRRSPLAGWLRRGTGFLLVVLVVFAAVRFLERRPPGGAPARSAAAPTVDPIGEGRKNAIVRAAEIVGPSVVSITAVENRVYRYSPIHPGFDSFFGQFFGQVPGTAYQEQVPKFGSGFIMDSDGHVLTNAHVVSGADQIQVSLPDGRQFKGKVLGAEADYDLAVLKIDAGNLPAAPLGDSEDLMVGEWAIAVGNPFGYLLGDSHPTVTVGVISATNRDIKADVAAGGFYKNMIQTDAAINPGNSGGPLVNSSGQVIGVNTFIFTQGGGSVGIGFAIPIKTAAEVAQDIIKLGHVPKVWIGLSVVGMNPWLAEQLGTQDMQGLVVARMERGSPADRSGIRVGDIIRAVGGQRVSDTREARRQIFDARAGDTIHFTVERDGKTLDIAVTLESMPGKP